MPGAGLSSCRASLANCGSRASQGRDHLRGALEERSFEFSSISVQVIQHKHLDDLTTDIKSEVSKLNKVEDLNKIFDYSKPVSRFT